MKKLLLSALICACPSLHPATAFAGERTYVSRNGTDAEPTGCLETAPCKNFAKAIEKANLSSPAGEIICLDSGFFGAFTITAPITINCENHIGQAGATINRITLPANGVVVLNGIDIDERSFGGNALTFDGQGTLIIRNSTIRNATNGVVFAPTSSAKLMITDSVIEDSTTTGISIVPAGAGTFRVDLDNVKSTNNSNAGVAVSASAGETVNLEIRNSLLAQNSNYGLYSGGSASGTSNVFIDNTTISNNGGIGVYSFNTNSVVRVNRSVLARNGTTWSFASGGALFSYGNNATAGAVPGTGPSGVVGLQ